MKKVISLLTVVALMAVLATVAFANGEFSLAVNTVEAAPGEEVVIQVSLVNNPGITVGEMFVEFDETALELVKLKGVGDEEWKWDPQPNKKACKFTFMADTPTDDEGEYIEGYTLTGDCVLFEVTLKVKDDVKPGTYDVKVAVDYIGDDAVDLISGETFAGAVVVPCDHVAGEPVKENEVAATCTAEGSYDEVVYCTVCGEELSRETKTTEKAPHVAGETVIENEVAATCSAEGSYDEVVYCTACGTEMSRETKTTEKVAHTPAEAVKENEVAGTCQKMGSYDEVVYCSVCGEELSRTTVETEMGEHVPGEAVKENVENADCKTPGSYDLVVRCTVCNEVLSTEHVDGELGDHVPGEAVVENEVAGTDCQTAGSYDVVVYCTVCGEELSRETKAGEVGAHGEHKHVDTGDGKTHNCVCSICDEVLGNEAHTYGDFVEDAENPGWKYQICTKCGYENREESGKTGDNSMIAVVAAVLSMTGIAVVVSKKKEF